MHYKRYIDGIIWTLESNETVNQLLFLNRRSVIVIYYSKGTKFEQQVFKSISYTCTIASPYIFYHIMENL